jgi:hypothetical protein
VQVAAELGVEASQVGRVDAVGLIWAYQALLGLQSRELVSTLMSASESLLCKLQVAQLAGIPADVITSARAKLQELEHQVLPAAPAPQPLHSLQTAQAAQPAQSAQKPGSTKPAQNDLFASTPHPALDRLLQLDPDELNPRQALEWLYEIKKML